MNNSSQKRSEQIQRRDPYKKHIKRKLEKKEKKTPVIRPSVQPFVQPLPPLEYFRFIFDNKDIASKT